MADLVDADNNVNKSQEMWGRVFLYLSNDNPATIDPAEVHLNTSCLVPMTSSIKPTLEKVAAKYSPIKSTYLIFENQLKNLNEYLDKNLRIFTLDGDAWELKGRYDRATSDNEPVSWKLQNNEYTLSLLCVCYNY